jgi:Ion channel
VRLAMQVAEIWTFAGVMRLLLLFEGTAQVLGMRGANRLDAVYLSAVTFTAVGCGDLVPVGPLRFLTGTEALTGLMLITWSASFTFLELEKFWRSR